MIFLAAEIVIFSVLHFYTRSFDIECRPMHYATSFIHSQFVLPFRTGVTLDVWRHQILKATYLLYVFLSIFFFKDINFKKNLTQNFVKYLLMNAVLWKKQELSLDLFKKRSRERKKLTIWSNWRKKMTNKSFRRFLHVVSWLKSYT